MNGWIDSRIERGERTDGTPGVPLEVACRRTWVRGVVLALVGICLVLETGCGGEPEVDLGAMHDVVVVGGGIAGLSAAHLLKGQDVVLLEKETTLGGRALSGSHQGVVYAKGTEYLGELEGTLADLAKDVALEPFEIPAPMDAKIQDRRLYVGEDAITDMMVNRVGASEYNRFVSTVQKAAAKVESGDLLDPEVQRLDQLSTRDWFLQQGFAPIFHEYYNVSCRGLFGANLGESSALCMIPEIGFDYTNGGAVSGRRRSGRTAARETAGTEAYTFHGGISTLCEGIARKLGDRVRPGSTVMEVRRLGADASKGFAISYKDASGQTHVLSSKAVIFAVPAPIALKLGSQALTEDQKDLLRSVVYAPYMTVALFSEAPIFDQAFDLAVPDGMFFTDLYPGSWAERGSAGSSSAHVLSAYVAPSSYRDDLLGLSDETVLGRTLADLDRLFPGASGKVRGSDIHRFPYGYPVMTVGAYGRMQRLAEMDGKGVFLAGDYLTNPTFDAAADSGAMAAEKCGKHLAAVHPTAP